MITIVKPSDLKLEELLAIYKLIESGGQIKTSPSILMKQICSCKYIAYEGSKFYVGACAAIKVPQQSYLDKIMQKIKRPIPELEIGYCVTEPKLEGIGLGTSLIKALMDRMEASFFATTHTDAMRHIFPKLGWTKAGNYLNDNNQTIDVFTYEI